MKTFKIRCEWTLSGNRTITVPDDYTLEQAIKYVKRKEHGRTLPKVGHYLDDSFTFLEETAEFPDN